MVAFGGSIRVTGKPICAGFIRVSVGARRIPGSAIAAFAQIAQPGLLDRRDMERLCRRQR